MLVRVTSTGIPDGAALATVGDVFLRVLVRIDAARKDAPPVVSEQRQPGDRATTVSTTANRAREGSRRRA